MSSGKRLIAAASGGDVGAVRSLLIGSAGRVAGFINGKDENENTALHMASTQGHTEVVRLLLEKGADIQAKDKDGYAALHTASDHGCLDVVRLLLEKRADIKAFGKSPGVTALILASTKGHLDVVRLLLEKGADADGTDARQTPTPLHMASQMGHVEVVRLLLEKGAGVKVNEGRLEVMRLLLEKGVGINVKGMGGCTPLHVASVMGQPEAVRLLLEKKADIEAENNDGQTPLDCAKNDATREVFRQFAARLAKKKKKNQKKNKKRKGKAAVDADSDSDAPVEGPDDVKESRSSSAPLPAPESALSQPPTVAPSSSATAATSTASAPAPAPDDGNIDGAMLAQRLQRVFRVRRLHRGLWRTRNERHGKAFDRKWGRVVEGMGRVRVGRKGGGGSSGTGLGGFRWEDEKAKYDMVLDRGSIEGEGGGVGGEEDGAAERADIRALQKIMGDVALTPAPLSAAWEEDSEEEEEQEYGQGVVQGQGMGQGQGQEQWGPVIYEIEVTGDVVRWRKEADAALFNMFYRRVQMLASGHRSYAYSKRLVDTTLPRGVHLRETKLNKGMRILWTQLRRGVEKPAILIWFVAKHDRVPHCMRQVGRSFRHRDWQKTQTKGKGQGVKGCEEGEVVELGEDESLLDFVSNAPLKTYTLDLHAQTQAHSNSGSDGGSGSRKKLPLRLSKRECEVNLAVGTVLLLGRSGTGKTVCLCNRMTSDRQSNPASSQLFVCRNHRLKGIVEDYQRDYGNLEEDSGGNGAGKGVQSRRPDSAFLTVDAFLDDMESRVLGAADMGAGADIGAGTTVAAGRGSGRGRRYPPSKRVDFRRFQQLFCEFGRPKLDPLVAWTQIRSFIKGSVEALLGEEADGSTSTTNSSGSSGSGSRALSLPAYLALSKGRCHLQPPERAEAYAVYVQYEALLLRAGLWDDCDRVMRILTTGLNLTAGTRGWGNGGSDWGGGGCGLSAFDKVYVDEVQDSSQIEIALYFLAAGMHYDRLFLAGDPAQSIVEGIDFRFEEVRGIVHALSRGEFKISSPVTLNINYRCHSRILNCASGVLDLLLSTFPHAADKLPRDEGVCGGPRPEYFADMGAGTGAGAGAFLRRLLLDNPLFMVLCRDEQCLVEGEGHGNQGGKEERQRLCPELSQLVPELTLALGIRASKGMEFPDVLLLNFFCDMPENQQRAWKLRLIDGHMHDTQPQMETQLKLLYTAITRSCARLIFAETRSSAAGDAFFRWLEREKLAEKMIQRDGAGQAEGQGGEGIYRSNDELRALGIQLAMSDGGIPALRIAAKYFQRAGDKAQNLLERVSLQEQVERAREGFSAALGDADTLAPAHEVELAALVLQCVELQLYQDALDLGSLLLPHLPAQSQALMRERVLGELRVFTAG